ncbi:MAG: hypothetical protein PHO15_04050 [Eubacteriales bacterium]|nr:hypothetical protein [Eubacteriales bacterium]
MTRKEYIEKKRELGKAMDEREILKIQHELAVKYNADITETKESEVWDMVLMDDTIDDLTDEEVISSTKALIASAIY